MERTMQRILDALTNLLNRLRGPQPVPVPVPVPVQRRRR
jgi:hypothetical protein